ncbi:MAG: hypothetical protein QOH25_1492 [Acidobacteriota bacterium]|jgi:hypothetical protein|nr:hypothetical protein [Acidobacteriota bacterium]
MGNQAKNKPTESPFTCDIAALGGTKRRRAGTLLRQLSEMKQELRELPDIYALRFPAGCRAYSRRHRSPLSC